jgi:cyclopropane fatty-acyl-phospholipid synthase-like methyltransferase
MSGIDLSGEAVRTAKARVAQAGVQHMVDVRQGNVLTLPFRNGHFDVVIDWGCFHHIVKADWNLYFSCIERVLKPSGYFSLTCYSSSYKHSQTEVRHSSWLIHRNHYDRFFSKRELGEILTPGFTIIDVTTERKGIQVFHSVLAQLKQKGEPHVSC